MSGGGKSVTVGYKYFLGVQLAVCHGPVDAVTEIIVGERQAWAGTLTSTGTLSINKPDLFGGDKREGGVSGAIDVLMGERSMAKNTYLMQHQGANCPAYRGLLTLVFRGHRSSDEGAHGGAVNRLVSFLRGFYWSAMNPYFKAPWVRVRCIKAGWDCWYPEKAEIIQTDETNSAGQNPRDMNPAHVLYKVMTNDEWGMGYTPDDFDDVSWKAAADKLYAEKFGLSLEWRNQMSIEAFASSIISHINGAIRMNLRTGKFELKLIRDDYVVNDLPLLDPSNVIEVSSFQRAAWGEMVNEIVVKYTDRNEDEVSVAVQDLAVVNIQGAVVSATKEYPGIRNPTLATKVALRDLRTSSTPLAKITLVCNRVMHDKAEGDVFRLTWPAPLNITNGVFRIVKIDKGNLLDGRIEIEAIEDVFGMPTNAYTKPPASAWVDPLTAPNPITWMRPVEASYWDVVRNLGEETAESLPAGTGYAGLLAARPLGMSTGFSMQVASAAAGPYSEAAVGTYFGKAALASAIDDKATSIQLASVVGLVDIAAMMEDDDGYVYIGDEICKFVSFNETTNTLVVGRGAIDTVPVAHLAGEAVVFAMPTNFDSTQRAASETVHMKALSINGIGVSPIDSAVSSSVTLNRRAERPYPPANVRLNGQYRPNAIAAPFATIEWSHRDRTQQTVEVMDNTQGNVGPEDGVKYDVKVYKKTAALTTFTLAHSTLTVNNKLTALNNALIPGVNDFYVLSKTVGRRPPFADFVRDPSMAPGTNYENLRGVPTSYTFELSRAQPGVTYTIKVPHTEKDTPAGHGPARFREVNQTMTAGQTAQDVLNGLKTQIDALYSSSYRAIRDAFEIKWTQGPDKTASALLHRLRYGANVLDVVAVHTGGAFEHHLILSGGNYPNDRIIESARFEYNGYPIIVERASMTYDGKGFICGFLQGSAFGIYNPAIICRIDLNAAPTYGIRPTSIFRICDAQGTNGHLDRVAFGEPHNLRLWIVAKDHCYLPHLSSNRYVDPAGDGAPAKFLGLNLDTLETVVRYSQPANGYDTIDGEQYVYPLTMGGSGDVYWVRNVNGRVFIFDANFSPVKKVAIDMSSFDPQNTGGYTYDMEVLNDQVWVYAKSTYVNGVVWNDKYARFPFDGTGAPAQVVDIVQDKPELSAGYIGDSRVKKQGNYIVLGQGTDRKVVHGSTFAEVDPITSFGLTTSVARQAAHDVKDFPPAYSLTLNWGVWGGFDAGSTASTATATGTLPGGELMPDMTDATAVRVEIKSVRDGLDSWQTQVLEATVTS